MAEKVPKQSKEGKAERTSRILRNLHAVGGVALLGAGVVAPPLAAVGVFEIVHAGGWEVARSHLAKKRKKQK